MSKRPKFKPEITRVKLNPEQAVLSCCCHQRGAALHHYPRESITMYHVTHELRAAACFGQGRGVGRLLAGQARLYCWVQTSANIRS